MSNLGESASILKEGGKTTTLQVSTAQRQATPTRGSRPGTKENHTENLRIESVDLTRLSTVTEKNSQFNVIVLSEYEGAKKQCADHGKDQGTGDLLADWMNLCSDSMSCLRDTLIEKVRLQALHLPTWIRNDYKDERELYSLPFFSVFCVFKEITEDLHDVPELARLTARNGVLPLGRLDFILDDVLMNELETSTVRNEMWSVGWTLENGMRSHLKFDKRLDDGSRVVVKLEECYMVYSAPKHYKKPIHPPRLEPSSEEDEDEDCVYYSRQISFTLSLPGEYNVSVAFRSNRPEYNKPSSDRMLVSCSWSSGYTIRDNTRVFLMINPDDAEKAISFALTCLKLVQHRGSSSTNDDDADMEKSGEESARLVQPLTLQVDKSSNGEFNAVSHAIIRFVKEDARFQALGISASI